MFPASLLSRNNKALEINNLLSFDQFSVTIPNHKTWQTYFFTAPKVGYCFVSGQKSSKACKVERASSTVSCEGISSCFRPTHRSRDSARGLPPPAAWASYQPVSAVGQVILCRSEDGSNNPIAGSH